MGSEPILVRVYITKNEWIHELNIQIANFRFGVLYSASVMLCELIVLEPRTQIAGMTLLIDASNYGTQHLRAMGRDEVRVSSRFMSVRTTHSSHLHVTLLDVLYSG